MSIGRPDNGFTAWLRLLPTRSPSFVLQARRATALLLASLNGRVAGVGSAFIVHVPPPEDGYQPDYVVVTARHNVDLANRHGATTRLRLTHQSLVTTEAPELEISANDWYYYRDHDVATAILPLHFVFETRDVPALPVRAFFNPIKWFEPVPAYVIGRCDVGGSELILVRRGWIPTVERARVRLDNFQDRVEVNLVEGVVEPGMSGGPVVVAQGPEDANNLVFGMTYGYSMPRTDDESEVDGEVDTAKDARRDLSEVRRELFARRQQLIYVVPGEHILHGIEQRLRAEYPGRTQLLEQLVMRDRRLHQDSKTS